MKIAQLSDIHGDVETLGKASRLIQKVGDIGVVAVTGDLAGRVLSGAELDYFKEVSASFRDLRNSMYNDSEGRIDTARKAAEEVLAGKVNIQGLEPGKLKEYAEDYLNLEAKTKEGMKGQYKAMKDILESMPQEVVLIPGNWDGKCMDDYLGRFNLHNRDNKNVRVKGVHFVGYGSCPMTPKEIPEEWLIPFNEGEAYKHLTHETKNDESTIALVHMPVGGYSGKGFRGSYALRAFMNLRQPDAVLQGHTHKYGVKKDKETGTLIVNPGNLGRYDDEVGGTFTEIDYNEETGMVTPYLWSLKGDSAEKAEFALKK